MKPITAEDLLAEMKRHRGLLGRIVNALWIAGEEKSTEENMWTEADFTALCGSVSDAEKVFEYLTARRAAEAQAIGEVLVEVVKDRPEAQAITVEDGPFFTSVKSWTAQPLGARVYAQLRNAISILARTYPEHQFQYYPQGTDRLPNEDADFTWRRDQEVQDDSA